jgi:peptide/nickel transport system substrate-binding protein
MTNTRRVVRLAAVGVVGALALAACSSSSSGGGSASSSSGAATGFNAAVDGIVNPSDKTGGTVKLGASGDCDSYDPARTYYAWCWDVQRIFTRSLMGFASKPGAAGTEVVPDLASGPPTVNADKTEFTYKLQDGLKWQDGSALTSADIKYGIERLYAGDVINGGPSSYYLCLLDTCAADGSTAYKGPYADPSGGLTSISTPDATTITFKLNKPFADFDYLMALPTGAPVPKSQDTKADYGKKPFASGPYMFQSFTPNQSTTWVKNPNWSQATDKIRSPKADTITLTVVSNVEDLNKRILAGDLDLTADGGLQPAEIATVIADPAKKANSDNPTTGFTRYFAVMQTVAPLDNKACREAVFYATNKADLRKIRGGDFGGDIANTMTPPIVPGFDPNANPYPSGADNSGDLTLAKQKLTECGQPNGFTVNFAYVNAGLGPKLFASMQQNLGRVGIKLTSAPGEQSTYYSTWIGSPANIKAKNIGVAVAGWGADFPTPYGFWQSIANGAAIVPNGNSNYPSLNDPAVNKLIDSLTTQGDRSAAADTGKQIDAGVMGNAVYLPYVFDKSFFYRNAKLTNVFLNGGVGNYYDFVNIGTSG